MTELSCEQFDFETLEEELQVDERCSCLLQQFHLWLREREGDLQRASELAYCVDYYLRDYLMDALRMNILRYRSGLVRYFAGTWYITRTFDPDVALVDRHLDGIRAYYRYLHELGLLPGCDLSLVEQEAVDREWFGNRVDDFLNLKADGYPVWESACPLSSAHEEVTTP